jgi:hypothetical protein
VLARISMSALKSDEKDDHEYPCGEQIEDHSH